MLNHYLRKVPIADLAKGLLRSGRNAEKNDFYWCWGLIIAKRGKFNKNLISGLEAGLKAK